MALKAVASFPLIPKWRYGGSTGKLRLYYSTNFIDNESRSVVGGAVGSQSFYDEADITIDGDNDATVAEFNLVTTEDSDHPNAKVVGVIYDEGGSARETLFEYSIPSNTILSSPTTRALLEAYNKRNTVINPPTFYLTQKQILDFLNAQLAALGIGPATNLALGIVRLRTAAAVPGDPEVFGTNDPLVRDALKLLGVNLDVLMATPADGNVIGYDAGSTTWKPQATATPSPHAASHENGGADEISVAGLSGLLADAQVPVAHAILHENGGLDEISVAGLSGLLADAQTPTAHASSHVSGGSDPFTSAQLLEAVIKRIRTSTGPTDLLVGAIADGEFLKRDGSGIVSGVPSGTGAPTDATYITQTPNGGLSAEQALSTLATGLVKNTTGTGVLSTVTAPSGAIVGDTDAQTLTNKTLTTPVVAQINDANGNELLKLGTTASAVNEVTITNKATGNAPTVEATGSDTDISLNLKSKGAGVVQANGNEVAIKNAEVNPQTGTTYTLVAADNGKVVTCSNASAITVTVPSGLGAGFNCLVVQLGAGQVTFSPSSTTINNRQSHTKIAGQYGVASLVAYVANTFALGGDTAS